MKCHQSPQTQRLSESLQDQQFAESDQAELEFEQGRVEVLADFLAELEPDETVHQHWLKVNQRAVRKARFVVGQGLVIG